MTIGGGLAGATLAWQLMMAAMMAPTAYPWLRAAGRLAPTPARFAALEFGAGYFVSWLPFSLALAVAQLALRGGWAHAAGWQGGLLLAAGLYQFAPLKRACLRHCRDPLSFLLRSWPGGGRSLLALGARHGLFCLGCCWALMATALAAGMANLLWMAALAVAAFGEQTLARGAWLRAALGLALIATGGVRLG
ncbi:MAG: DUF2182 domain-containing protein [Terriglobales bacterium]